MGPLGGCLAVWPSEITGIGDRGATDNLVGDGASSADWGPGGRTAGSSAASAGEAPLDWPLDVIYLPRYHLSIHHRSTINLLYLSLYPSLSLSLALLLSLAMSVYQ